MVFSLYFNRSRKYSTIHFTLPYNVNQNNGNKLVCLDGLPHEYIDGASVGAHTHYFEGIRASEFH